jgi:Fe-S-cluster-containing hydrogenase component 2
MERVFDMPSCGGCRTCELACSFRHQGEFSPVLSSLKVLDKKEGPGYLVSLVSEKEGQRFACDGCKGIDVPHCVQFCKQVEDLEKILDEFMKEAKS